VNEVEPTALAMLTDPDTTRSLSATKRTIVPFASHFRETKPISICSSREEEIRSRVEALIELMIVVAGLTAIIAVLS
jgi:hypothetical protein